MSDENDSTIIDDTNGGDPIPDSDRTADIVALMANVQALQGTVRDLERQLVQKQYELDISGGLARLNVASHILGGMFARPASADYKVEATCRKAAEFADFLVTSFEEQMEARAAEWAKQATAQHAEATNPAEREN